MTDPEFIEPEGEPVEAVEDQVEDQIEEPVRDWSDDEEDAARAGLSPAGLSCP